MIDTTGVIGIRCLGGNRGCCARGETPWLMRGVKPALENHLKSLGHYTGQNSLIRWTT